VLGLWHCTFTFHPWGTFTVICPFEYPSKLKPVMFSIRLTVLLEESTVIYGIVGRGIAGPGLQSDDVQAGLRQRHDRGSTGCPQSDYHDLCCFECDRHALLLTPLALKAEI
jgi:hypothetical protein